MVELGAPLLSLLAPSLVFLTLETLTNTALEAKGFYKIPIFCILLGNIPKIAISYFLIADPRFGISAAPIGTLVSYATGFLFSLIFLYIKTDIHISLLREIVPPAISSSVALFVTDFISNVKGPASNPVFNLVIVMIFGVIYLTFMAIITYCDKKYRKSLSIYTKNSITN
jgi:Na+-driven multidrug efflux pump